MSNPWRSKRIKSISIIWLSIQKRPSFNFCVSHNDSSVSEEISRWQFNGVRVILTYATNSWDINEYVALESKSTWASLQNIGNVLVTTIWSRLSILLSHGKDLTTSKRLSSLASTSARQRRLQPSTRRCHLKLPYLKALFMRTISLLLLKFRTKTKTRPWCTDIIMN